MPASSSFASIWVKAKVEETPRISQWLILQLESLPIKNVTAPARATVPAGTLLAGLELEREGAAALAQDEAFGAVRLARPNSF